MGCAKGKDQCRREKAKVCCEKCDALAEKKKEVCHPQKLADTNKADKKQDPKIKKEK